MKVLANNTLLVVDDNEAILEVIKIALEDEGYCVETATCGQELKKKLRTTKPELLVIDYWLPGEDGGQLTRYVKKSPQTKQLPIIMISANHNIEKTAYACGVDVFLPKPFDINKLLSLVDQQITQHKLRN